MSALEVVELVVGDPPAAWREAGFTVDDAGIARVGTVRIRCTGSGESGILGWVVRGVDDPAELDGLATIVCDEPLAAADDHLNFATIVDHVVVMTPAIERTIAAFRAAGCVPRRERAAGSRDRPLRQMFLRAGEVIIEVVGPPTLPQDPERAGAPAAFWGIACTVSDIDGCAVVLGDRLGAVRDAVQPGRRIATLRHERLGVSVPIAFMS